MGLCQSLSNPTILSEYIFIAKVPDVSKRATKKRHQNMVQVYIQSCRAITRAENIFRKMNVDDRIYFGLTRAKQIL